VPVKKDAEAALQELKSILVARFGGEVELKLFGSVARGDDAEYSDIDVLVLLPGHVDHAIEERVFDAAYDLELKYSVVFGIVVYDKAFWESELAAGMYLHRNIDREGLPV
jgi:predicted nucleotidyltransferase